MKNSVRYLLIYILSLIGFAFVYHFCLESQFYHSSIQREPAYIQQQEIFKTYLTRHLDLQFRSEEVSRFIITDSVGTVIPFRVEQIAIDKVKQIDEDEFLVTASLGLIPITEKVQYRASNWIYIANVSFTIRNWAIFQFDHWMIDNVQIKKVMANPNTAYREKIEGLKYPIKSDSGMKSTTFTDDIGVEMTKYASATSGQPKSSIDNLFRMFYLSAVTITTTGYGDIVPLTNLARLLVALEAFWGITIIGLFLNAKAREIVERRWD